jgi:hypothetical protein
MVTTPLPLPPGQSAPTAPCQVFLGVFFTVQISFAPSYR